MEAAGPVPLRKRAVSAALQREGYAAERGAMGCIVQINVNASLNSPKKRMIFVESVALQTNKRNVYLYRTR